MTADRIDLSWNGISRNAAILLMAALCKENMSQSLGLIAIQQLYKQIPRTIDPSSNGRSNTTQGPQRKPTPHLYFEFRLMDLGNRIREHGSVRSCCNKFRVVVAQRRKRAPVRNDLSCVGDAGRDGIPSKNSSINPRFSASSAPMGSPPMIISTALAGPIARGNRCVAPPPGTKRGFTSGWPKPRLARGDPEMASHGDLKTTAEGYP